MQWASATAALRRTLPYVAVWLSLVLLLALTPLNVIWHKADFWLLQHPLNLGSGLGLDRELSVVDLDVDSTSDITALRAHEIALLDAINASAGVAAVPPAGGTLAGSCAASARHIGKAPENALSGASTKPQSIVFDAAFLSSNSALSPQCVAPIVAELRTAQLAGIKIYGVKDIESQNSGGSITGNLELDPNYERNHDARIYAEFTGTGHTLFAASPDSPSGPLITYPKVVNMPGGSAGKGGVNAPCALPIVTVGQADDECLPLLEANQQDENVNVVVPLGASGIFEGARISYEQAVKKPGVLAGQIVLVGDEKIDTAPGDPRSKFEMLAWAMSQSIAGLRSRPYPRVLVDVNIMIALAIGGSVLALATFVFFFRLRKGKALQIPEATLFSLAVPAVALYAVEASLVGHNELFSQLTFPLLAIVITIGVALWAGIAAVRRDLFVLSLQDHTTAVPERYDVFISYARPPENAAWVEEHVLGPLSRAKMPDGKPLRIFFDRQSIKVGFGWYTTIVESIYGSRYFLPVYSEGYFDRPFCRDEMDIAMLRQVELGTFVLPVARVATGIPDRYARTQFVDVAREPAFMDDIIRIITQPSEAPVEKGHYSAVDLAPDRKSNGTKRGTVAPETR